MTKISLLKSRSSELLKVSAPLMISFLSMLGMTFVNRIFLANYSLDALSAMVSAGTVAFSVTFGIQTLTLIASVFVAQLHGAGKTTELGAPVWQMVWFSLATYIIVIPIAVLAKHLLFLNSAIAAEQILVFQCVMLISPLFALLGSLESFYNGQRKTLVITYLNIIGNLINIILDPILIFGFKDLVPSLGIVGAFIANAIGLLVTIAILFGLFLQQKNRTSFGTNKWKINRPLMLNCIKVGSPEAIGIGAELLCWGIFYNIMATLGQIHIIVTSVAQSIFLLLIFFGLGLEQGCSIIAANLIGAKRKHEVKEIFLAGCILVAIATLTILILFYTVPDLIINCFFYKQLHFDHAIGDTNTQIITASITIIKQCLPLVGLYIGVEAIRWTLNGLLRAAGDTFFLLISGVLNIVLFMLLPTYLLMVVYKQPIEVFFQIWLFFSVVSAAISYWRFRHGRWQNITLIKH